MPCGFPGCQMSFHTRKEKAAHNRDSHILDTHPERLLHGCLKGEGCEAFFFNDGAEREHYNTAYCD